MVYYPRRSKAPAKKGYKKPYKKMKKSAAVVKLSKDVSLLKRAVAGEKKVFNDGLVANTAIGQSFINGDAAFALDLTPRPIQGPGEDERIGRQIKLVSMSLQYQVKQQTASSQPIKVQMFVVRIMGTPMNVGTAYQEFKLPNPITGVRDLMATRDLRYFKNFRIIKAFTCYLPQDAATGNLVQKSGRINLKLNHYITFDNNLSTVTEGQLAMFAFADSGNTGGSNSTLPNVVTQNPNTGAFIQTYTKFWYTDN